MAKAYKFEVVCIDLEGMSENDIIYELERSKHCSFNIIDMQISKEFDWDDDHPLNKKMTYEEYLNWWLYNG